MTTAPKTSPFHALLLLALLVLGCGGGSGSGPAVVGDAGEVLDGPGGTRIFVDPHQGGFAAAPALVEILVGRLVELAAVDENGAIVSVASDFLIAEDVESDEELGLDGGSLAGGPRLVVAHPPGSPEFEAALARATAGLRRLDVKSDEPNELPPFTFVPRNAALSLRFDDLIDPDTVHERSVRLLTGDFDLVETAARVVPDPNYGALVGLAGGTAFRSTRVIVDPAISELEALADPSLPIRPTGLPPSFTDARANASLHIATRPNPARGLFEPIANLAGNLLDAGDGPLDAGSDSRDIVRAFRSGSPDPNVGDPYAGFLPDDRAPRIVGRLGAVIEAVSPNGGSSAPMLVDLLYETATCALAAAPGDVIRAQDTAAVVVHAGAAPSNGRISGIGVRPLTGELTDAVGFAAIHETRWDPSAGAPPACFIGVEPLTAGALVDVDPRARFTVAFDEPMDPSSLNGLEGLALTRVPSEGADPAPTDIVVATTGNDDGLRTFRLQPRLPLSHVEGEAESYFLHFGLSRALRDLAGNALVESIAATEIRLDPAAPTDRTGGYVFRFEQDDEDGNGAIELRGQVRRDLDRGALLPRPVQRMALPIEPESNPLIGQMQPLPHGTFASPFDGGVRAPLHPMGARVMASWRYADVGLPLFDESTHDVDVEGLSWAPKAGTIAATRIDGFSISLAHSRELPDEAAIPHFGMIFAPGSGLRTNRFEDNVLEGSGPVEVHRRNQGYTISPADEFFTPAGRKLLPFPMNREADPTSHRYYTWRDTAVTATGGDGGLGVPFGGLVPAGLLPSMDYVGLVAQAGFVPSIALPLLIDFKCDAGDFGSGNVFDVMLGGFPTSFGFALPADHRISAVGGVDGLGEVRTVDPHIVSTPSGGFNEVPALGPLGQPTAPGDSIVYLSQLDLVTRKSRAHMVWLDKGNAESIMLEPITAPHGSDQPARTHIEIAFRGADFVVGPATSDAARLDIYGDEPSPISGSLYFDDPLEKNQNVVFTDGSSDWREDAAGIAGSRFFQPRLTFTSDAATGATPHLDALGFAFDLPN